MTASSRPVSLAQLSAIDLDALEMIRLAADAGYSGVLIRLHPARREEPARAILTDAALRRQARQLLQDLGLQLFDTEVLTIYPDSTPEDFRPLFEAMADMAIRHVAVNSEDPNHARLTDSFSRLCDAAAPYDISLDLEFMRYRQIRSLDQALEMMAASGSANCSIIIDTLHFFRAGHAVTDLARIPQGRVGLIQLSDAPAQSPPLDGLRQEALFDRLAPGKGDLPIAELVAALPATLPLSVEVPSSQTTDKLGHARMLLAATRDVLAAADLIRAS